MVIKNTPMAEQIRIVLFGLRNTGKSSLMNYLFEREISIVSATPGTTTDPVNKSIELGALGPVVITDTAGLDDAGSLGGERIRRSVESLQIADLPLFVTRADMEPTEFEKATLFELSEKKPVVIAVTHSDIPAHPDKISWVKKFPFALIDNIKKTGAPELKKLLVTQAGRIDFEMTPVEGLVSENDLVILVTPIDLAAPRGRLILPQVETIRDLLDKDCASLVLKERELKTFYDALKIKPKLVITDSQAFSKVAADIPEDQMLTSFSILFARKKGDLGLFVEGLKGLKKIAAGSKVLVLESCAHHKQADDIGTVKIPRLFRQMVQPQADFEFLHTLPEEEKLKEYSLVINCAGCMSSRNQILNRLETLKRLGIPVTNYGLFLAWVNGLLPRALEPFPLEYGLYGEN